MFHVSTLLPYAPADELKLSRSRVIGNDVVNIVFQEGDTPFIADCLPGAVSHVFIVVRPVTVTSSVPGAPPVKAYRIGCCSRLCVPEFPPALSTHVITDLSLFRDVLLTKVLNGHIAAQHSPGLSMMYTRPRSVLLSEVVCQFAPKLAPPQ